MNFASTGALPAICLVHPAIWKTLEEGIPLVDGNRGTDAELRRLWCHFSSQGHKIEFVAARTM